jgi:4-hydroxy 2-oxovalerate aldolase
MAFLKNPKFDLRPVLAVIQSHLLPLQKSIEWGYHIPYLITGALNEHPRSAMKFMADADHSDFVRFYDQMTEVTPLE